MCRLTALNVPPGGFWEFFQKRENDKGLIQQRHHIHALQYKINYRVCIHINELP